MPNSSRNLDAVIITDSGIDSLSGTNPLKLHLDGRAADIQVVANYLANNGRVTPPVAGDNRYSWSSAPTLNGLYLYSFLTGKDFQVALIDNYRREKNRFLDLLAENPLAVIISTSFIFFKQNLHALAEDIRAAAPDICIIAGGPFINYSAMLLAKAEEKGYETNAAADDFLFLRVDREPDIDLYITSPRGEGTLCRTLEKLDRGLPLDSLENSARLSGGRYLFGPVEDDATDAPPPEIDWQTLPPSVFRGGVVPVQASNGCPYHCSFCNFSKDRRLTFVKPLEQLSSELKIIEKRGARYAWFVDDNFRLGRNDLDAVCRHFLESGIRLKWMCFIRAGTLQQADIGLLREAGCMEVQIGLESGDPGILANMNKETDPAMYREVIGRVLAHGINVSCYFITGFPGETEQTAAATRNFIRSIEYPEAEGVLSWSIYPFILSPLSPVYAPEMRRKFQLRGYMHNWSHRTMDSKQARQEVKTCFLELTGSGPIYRGDNLSMLRTLPDRARKDFFRTRHLLAQKSLGRQLEPEEIIKSFSGLFR